MTSVRLFEINLSLTVSRLRVVDNKWNQVDEVPALSKNNALDGKITLHTQLRQVYTT